MDGLVKGGREWMASGSTYEDNERDKRNEGRGERRGKLNDLLVYLSPYYLPTKSRQARTKNYQLVQLVYIPNACTY